MSALFRIVYAAHANGTHHKLALDALNHMERPDAEAWRRVFLQHVGLYLEGSKAPDNSFKDFKNHVLHVGDAYWGGAPEKVEAWFGHTVTALRAEKWADAAYAAGVLSHYYTDPVHPFHTGQTEAENSIHRACEWSINRSYNDLRALGEKKFGSMRVVSHQDAHWLKQMTCDGAEFSHRYYEKLIAHYDLKRGVVRPEEGLDEIARTIVAELLMYAADGFGHILDRAIAEAGVAAPEVSLTLETFLATLKIPAKWVEKKLSNAEDRRIVQAMYDELQATGKVEHTLPEDDRVIRDLHKREVLDRSKELQLDKRSVRIPDGDPADVRRIMRRSKAALEPVIPRASAGSPGSAEPLPAVVKIVKKPTAVETARELPPVIPNAAPKSVAPEPPAIAPPPVVRTETPKPGETPVRQEAAKPTAITSREDNAVSDNVRRVYLKSSDDLEAAPSIGPKMAQRFADLGIVTVADFMNQSPDDMAELLDDKRIDAGTLEEWQDQAELVMQVPGLRGTHAQLLTGAGYRTVVAVADADPVEFSADVLKFATSPDGKRILRDGNTPDLEKIKGWLEAAQEAMAA
jgi:predicted flap endonuclease-1-like 5' DNA nuclease